MKQIQFQAQGDKSAVLLHSKPRYFNLGAKASLSFKTNTNEHSNVFHFIQLIKFIQTLSDSVSIVVELSCKNCCYSLMLIVFEVGDFLELHTHQQEDSVLWLNLWQEKSL